MNKHISYLVRAVAIVDICCLVVLTILSLIKGTDIDLYFCFNVLICFLFSTLLLKNGYCKEVGAGEYNSKRKSWIYFLLFAGTFLSIVKIYMFYEELIKDRGSISCAIAAIAAYTLFDSVNKYIIRKE